MAAAYAGGAKGSFIMFNMLFTVFYAARDVDREADAAAVAVGAIIFSIVYTSAGCGLIFLSQQRPDNDRLKYFRKAQPNKRTRATADANDFMFLSPAGRRVIGGVRFLSLG